MQYKRLNNYILTVSYIQINYKETPFIRLQGKWLGDVGFRIGDKIEIQEKPEELVIRDVKDNLNKE